MFTIKFDQSPGWHHPGPRRRASNQTTSSAILTAEELKYEAEVNEDSVISDEEGM